MEHTRKMASVDPRLLEALRPPPPTHTLGRVLRGLDGEMSLVLDRTDLDQGDNIELYNQILLRYNTMANKRVKQPTRVVVVNDDGAAAAAAAAAMQDGGTATAAAEPLAATGRDVDIVEIVPKSLKPKALRLMKRLRNDPSIQWNDRGGLIIEGSAIPGNNMIDLVHDVLRKRKQSDPVGWQPFAKHLKHINLPMELVGNVDRRQYMQQTTHGSSPRWSDRVKRQAVRSPTTGSRHRQAPSSNGWESYYVGLVSHLWHSRVMTAVGCRSITVVVGVIVCLIFYVTVFVLRHRLSLPLAWCSGGLVVEINNTTNGTWGAAEQPRNRSYLDVATSMPNA